MMIFPTKKRAFPAACIALVACFGVDAAPTHTVPTPEGILQLQCGAPFRDNAVLQQEIKLPVWGECQPGARVTIRFDGQTKSTRADKDGVWRVTLDPMNAGKLKSVNDSPAGKTMIITCEKDGEKEIKMIRNLLVGEVWLCAGQSNMAGRMGRAGSPKHFPPDSIDTADFPALRQMISPKQEWLVCSPESAVWFKKVCFFFGRRLQSDILVPVGIINAAVGGSNIESWLNDMPYERGKHYDAMIAPLEGFGLRGALWYQGESNERDGRAYQPKLESLITGWRKVWGQGDFPVYFVQLPGIGKSSTDNPVGGDGRAEIRQAYAETLALPNTGMAVTIDIGDVREHPPNKYDTGVRLACLALKHDYGFKDTALSPIYKKHNIEGSVVRISFDHAEDGLVVSRKEGFLPPKATPDAKLQWLSVQSKDGIWHWAEGRIEGSQLLVSSKSVNDPVSVRYAYTQHPSGNLLYSKGGQPVAPFSTNGYETKTVPETQKGKHLFILSGQSNMAGLNPDISFAPAVTKALGKDRVVVVKDAHSGQSIRSWCKSNHEVPPPTTGRVPKVRGEHYGPLMKKVKAEIEGQTLQTVTFVWMQGESDLNNTAYDAYLKELLDQLQEDLTFRDINLVIGRISDCGLDREKRLEGRLNIRRIQQEFAEAHPRGAWVNTDDLNDRTQDGKTFQDLHYTPEGYRVLGQRFAKKAIVLVRRESARNTNESK